MAHDVFICYASRDKVIADGVCARLESRHIRCWISPRDLPAGMSYADSIINALSACRILVVLLSSESIISPHVANEVERALHNGKAILPVRIEDVQPTGSLEYFLAGRHWLDALTPPLEAHLERVADAASRLLGLEPKQEPQPVDEHVPPSSKPSGFQAKKMFNDAEALRQASQHSRAVVLYRQAMMIYEILDEKSGAALCANNMAFCLQPNNNPAGSWNEALSNYHKALALREALNDKPNQLTILNNIAVCFRPELNPNGNWQKAGEAYRREAKVAAEVGDKATEAKALSDAGYVTMLKQNPQGNWAEGAALYSQAAKIYEELKDGLNLGITLHQKAFCLIQGKEANLTDEARQIFGRAAELMRSAGDNKNAENAEVFAQYIKSESNLVLSQAIEAFNARQFAQGALLYEKAAALFAAEGNTSQQAKCLHDQAWCVDPSNSPTGNWATCVALYRKAADLRAAIGDVKGQADTLGNLGVVLYPSANPTGDWDEASKALLEAAELKRKVGDQKGEAVCLHNLAYAYQCDHNPAGSWERAIEYYNASLALIAKEDAPSKANTLRNLGSCFQPTNNAAGDWEKASMFFQQAGEIYRSKGNLQAAGECFHQAAFCIVKGDSNNMTEQTWEMFHVAAQLKRQAGDTASAEKSETWLH